jgi:hypothetical protein
MEGPIGTTLTGTRGSEVDSAASKEKADDKKNIQRKSVPEEGNKNNH